MNTYIGIDLGTSSVKLLLTKADGEILAEVSREYDVSYPRAGWTEQSPSFWWEATSEALDELLDGQCRESVKGISFGGQMHGLVVLDGNDNVIRPCILWNDGRTEKETEYLNNVIGKEKLSSLTGNIAFAGFTAPKLLWMKENEPENFGRISKIMLPKDYIAYLLSGVHATDLSDASGMLTLDVKNRRWSEEMCKICGVTEKQLPRLYESYEVIGNLKPELCENFGLSRDVKIIIGAGDNAAAAVGTGTVKNGDCNVSLGTSGTVFIASDSFSVDENNALHSFCHAGGGWHLMGCILSAASCRKWWLEEILGSSDYAASDNASAECKGTGGVYFLPYLTGERSPHNDVNIRGAFFGLSATTTRAQMSRAIMEGVAFAIRDCLEIARLSGVSPTSTKLCGGGSKSTVWRQIMADVLGIPVQILNTEQGPAFGAAILAAVGCGEYKTVSEGAEKIVKVKETVYPNAESVERYQRKYEIFKQLYPAIKGLKLNGR